VRLGLVTEAFADRSLADLLDWLEREAPEITDLEIDSGGYAPQAHCDRATLLADPEARRRWRGQIEDRGLRIGALNAWGNPLHPDAAIAMRHDADLCETIRLAAELEVDRIVAMAGCPAAAPGDSVPHFAGGGWLPYLEDVYERQWHEDALPYWAELALSVLRAEGQESAVDLAGRVDRVRPDLVLRRPCHPPWPGCQRRPRLRGDPA
jgi:sugar phosphate isomerase/epimerase